MKVSRDCRDALVEVLFRTLPAMEGRELGALLGALLRIVQRELASALIRKDAMYREQAVQLAADMVERKLASFWQNLRRPAPH